MARLGIFCPPWTGHLNPFFALAHELTNRGHDVLFFNVPDAAEAIQRHGFAFEALGEQRCPSGTFAEQRRALSGLDGLTASRVGLDMLRTIAEIVFTEAWPVIERAGLDLWIVDQLDYAASTLAAHKQAPFVTVIVGLMMHREEGVPGFSGEPYSQEPAVLERDRRFHEALRATSKPFRDYIEGYRMQAGLGPFRYDTLWSNLAQITQQPAAFEFPRRNLPACFHFTGPFVDPATRPRIAFPWEQLDEKPLIYTSFGTVQNRTVHLYEAVARATADMDVQVVLSLGGAEASAWSRKLPGDPVVVSFAPQLALLEKAALMVTHGGMNSTLEGLRAGVPMVVVPIAHDQFGMAARIEWTGTGVRVPLDECNPARMQEAIRMVRGEASFRAAARRLQRIIEETDGLRRAADIIERVLAREM